MDYALLVGGATAPSVSWPSISSSFRLENASSVVPGCKRSQEVVCGFIGGPLVVGALTPLRNAMTLGAKDTTSSLQGLYQKVFTQGFLQGFRGGSKPVLAAVRKYTAVGPFYHFMHRHTDSIPAAMLGAAVMESLMTFSAHKHNAQVQYNATRMLVSEKIAYQPVHRIVAPGFQWHVGRNFSAMLGIRMFSPQIHEQIDRLPAAGNVNKESKLLLADFVSSVVAASLSMPFNHMFSWSACTPELNNMSWARRTEHAQQWFVKTYLKQGMKLFGRDLLIRINYTSLLFTGYSWIERSFPAWSGR